MSVTVSCPECNVACAVPPELLGRTGSCNGCGRRIRLAAPVAEMIPDAPAAAPAYEPEEPDEPVLLDEPGEIPQKPARAARRTRDEDERDEPDPRPGRHAAPPRRASAALLVLLAAVGLAGGGVGGALLVRHLMPPEPRTAESPRDEKPNPNPGPPPDPPAPKPPEPQPQPQPKPPEPRPQPPEPKPPEPKPPEPKPDNRKAVKLPGEPASVLVGGGRYVIFHVAKSGELAMYDAKADQSVWTLKGAAADDLLAVSREKLFIGKQKDARIDRFDLATAKGEGSANWRGGEVALKNLAAPACAEGPLLAVTQSNNGAYRLRLFDATTFAEMNPPIEDPTLPVVRAFPISATTMPRWIAASADGRAFTLGNRYLARTDRGYKGGLLTGIGTHAPAPDGESFVGTSLFGAGGARVPLPELPAGTRRQYLPAGSGPFMVSVEYRPADLGALKLALHLGADPKPLGELPGAALVAAWAKTEPGWVAKLPQRLVFVAEPARLIFAPPGGDVAHVWPVDLGAMLAASGRHMAFTSVPVAEVRVGKEFAYRATVAGGRAPVTFAVDGPLGLQIKGEVVSWPALREEGSHQVQITARDADGRIATQSFRLFVTKESEAKPKEKEKEEPKGPEPKEKEERPPKKEP